MIPWVRWLENVIEFILSVSIVLLLWRVGKIENQLLEEKYKLRELRKRLFELELRDIDECWRHRSP